MPIMPQDLVHRVETAISGPIARFALAVMAVVALAVAYDWRQARNLSTQEAMDSAQLARNISEGKGFTTQFVRPFSMFLIRRANQERLDSLPKEQLADLCRVKGDHPDIANAPLYPLMLAGWMKVLPFHFKIDPKPGEGFSRYQPDFLITVLNQLLFIATAVLVFFLARKIFDATVGWLSILIMLGTDLLWRFSASGQSTMLLLLLFVLLLWTLVKLDTAVNDTTTGLLKISGLAIGIGLLLGAGMLTRYAYGIVVLPVLGYLLLFAGRWKFHATGIVLVVFAAVVAPWIARNLQICGMPFGTATYAAIENSLFFPQQRLERSLQPDFTQLSPRIVWWKFFTFLKQIVSSELPKLAGGWILGFFVTGLLVRFRNTQLTRLRYFALALVPVLAMMQALGRTTLSDDSPDINSENLLVLLLPLVVIYGSSFFHTLLDQLVLPEQVILPAMWVRRGAMTLFVLLCTLPLTMSFLPGRVTPLQYAREVAFPPYNPPDIQKVANWIAEDELVMSDAPWAMAWYGDRQTVFLTIDARRSGPFYEISDYIKPVRALYLTPLALDARILSQWMRGQTESTWGEIIVASQMKDELPAYLRFPLVKAYRMNEQLFLSDWERWLKPEDAPPRK
ncbi:MAG: hypothetical protein RLY20_2672 [Verrucomicrobiota bacterium]|jgi:hypothetical protein